MMEKFSKKFNIPIPDGLPPCSLKEIYQLPHKGKGKENEDEEKEDKKKKTPTSGNPSQFNIADILNVSPTDNMTDVWIWVIMFNEIGRIYEKYWMDRRSCCSSWRRE